MSMGCNKYQCPANSNYNYGRTDSGTGVCRKDSTFPELLDNYAEHCSFIRVTDSWTLWKFGVPFKELNCGNCQNYAPGEYSHGICTNGQVKPHIKGIKVNGETTYEDSKEYYSGALACKEFKKKEGENLAKKTYWTKCGFEFQKPSTAEVTGYELKLLPSATDPLKVEDDIERVECRTCPFVGIVEEGYPDPIFKRFECRAGSKKPNHKTDWTGSLDDKNTIGINSLDHDLMEKILQYCKDHPDLYASYNTDHLADCRRTLSIGCSSNKKGIAAKKELIDKFFGDKRQIVEDSAEKKIQEIWNTFVKCESCSFSEEYGDGVYTLCTEGAKKKRVVKSKAACHNFVPADVQEDPEQDHEEKKPFCKHNECPFHACMSPDCQLKEVSESAPHMFIEYGPRASECCTQEVKKKFISDFIGAKQEIEKVKQDCTTPTRTCGKCNAGHWYSEENTYVSVVSDDGIKTTKRPCEPHTHYCYQFTEGQKKIAADKDFNPDMAPEWCPLEKHILYTFEARDDSFESEDKDDPYRDSYPYCNQDGCPFNNSNCDCLFNDEDPQSDGYSKDVIAAVGGYGCKAESVLKQYEAINNVDFTDYTIDAQEYELISEQPEKKKPRVGTESGCNDMREDCLCFCKHNDGCSVLLCRGDALKGIIKTVGDVDCDVYRKVAEKVNDPPENDNNTPENVNDLAEIDTKTAQPVTFDYSTVDDETAEFLQEKASKITEIRLKSVLTIGKELKEAQDKLSSHNKYEGVFVKWVESTGFKKSTAYDYLRAYDYVVRNSENIVDFEKFQPSLLFAVSKPTAPKELQEQVLSGDITTHKQYKEKEAEWKTKVDEVRAQQELLRNEKQQAITRAFDAERKADRLEVELEELQDELHDLKNQTEHKDPELISKLQDRINELEKQEKDKPIEATAVKVVEKIPEKNAAELSLRLFGTLMAAHLVTKEEIRIVADTANFERKESIIDYLESLQKVIPGYLDILKGYADERKCDECHYCDWEGLKEEDERKGLIYCKFLTPHNPRLWPNEKACENWMERQV